MSDFDKINILGTTINVKDSIARSSIENTNARLNTTNTNILNKFKLGDTIINIEDLDAQTKLKNLASVATSGSYADLTNRPTITYDSETKTVSFTNF